MRVGLDRSLAIAFATLLYCGILIGVLIGACAAADSDDLRRRFETEAPQAWDRWARQLDRIDVKYHIFREQFSDSKYPRVQEDKTVEYFAAGDRNRLHYFVTLPDDTKHEQIDVRRGDEYTFSADRQNSEPLLMTNYELGRTPIQKTTTSVILREPLNVEHVALREWMANPRFSVKSVSEEKGLDDKALVRVKFDYRHTGDRMARFQSGHVDLSPEDDWLIQNFRVKLPEGWYHSQSIEYGEGSPRSVAKITKDYYGKDGETLAGKDVITFERWDQREIPDAFFSAKAVGLPELWSPRRQSRWLILFVSGVVLLLVAAVISYRGRARA